MKLNDKFSITLYIFLKPRTALAFSIQTNSDQFLNNMWKRFVNKFNAEFNPLNASVVLI